MKKKQSKKMPPKKFTDRAEALVKAWRKKQNFKIRITEPNWCRLLSIVADFQKIEPCDWKSKSLARAPNKDGFGIHQKEGYVRLRRGDFETGMSRSKEKRMAAIRSVSRLYLFLCPTREMLELADQFCSGQGIELVPGFVLLDFRSDLLLMKMKDLLSFDEIEGLLAEYARSGVLTPRILETIIWRAKIWERLKGAWLDLYGESFSLRSFSISTSTPLYIYHTKSQPNWKIENGNHQSMISNVSRIIEILSLYEQDLEFSLEGLFPEDLHQMLSQVRPFEKVPPLATIKKTANIVNKTEMQELRKLSPLSERFSKWEKDPVLVALEDLEKRPNEKNDPHYYFANRRLGYRERQESCQFVL